MSHFAKIDKNNIVTQVIVAEKDFINSGVVGDEFLWVQTSYNNNFRGKYAAIGDTWDEANGVFIAPQPYPSWTLDVDFNWNPPTPHPEDGLMYKWDEASLQWLQENI